MIPARGFLFCFLLFSLAGRGNWRAAEGFCKGAARRDSAPGGNFFKNLLCFAKKERYGPLFFFLRGRKKKSAPGWRRKNGPCIRLAADRAVVFGHCRVQNNSQLGTSRAHDRSLSAAAFAQQVRMCVVAERHNRCRSMVRKRRVAQSALAVSSAPREQRPAPHSPRACRFLCKAI